ncbi:hypothetical protein E2C01_030330 [Portunus trituberculatus]|uniref:HTH psq-type domain-containing protein n=1 Tax=Portunus trituberculatus TaxID=210409 RepID=A0A5B7EX13_PORTR|nr:hypothetical protein [Portunus trituberculatus]
MPLRLFRAKPPPRKKHNFLPFKDKLELIRKYEAGIAHSVVAVQIGVLRSTVSSIWKKRDKYCKTAASVFISKSVLYTTLVTMTKKRGSIGGEVESSHHCAMHPSTTVV